jgi:glycerol-3-phosphate acyltransferase PlsX
MSEIRPVIAVDASGGDHGPSVVVPGAVAAFPSDSSAIPYDLALYGDETAIRAELDKLSADDLPISVVHCSQDIEMGEKPASAIKNKQDSPIVRSMADQKAGRVQAVVSAGSTGAMVAASLIVLGRIEGVSRPAIGTVIPTVKGGMLLLDSGANTVCSAEHLLSFAHMGAVFAKELFGQDNPAVGQLNIGGEPGKGTELNVETYKLLEDSGLNFVGNVEGNQLLIRPCDVVVTDGYTGNNTLKMIEGFARFMGALAMRPDMDDAVRASFKPVLCYLQENFSYEAQGGAMLLGVNGVSIIAHGRSSSLAIQNAVKEAWDMVHAELPRKIAAGQD